VSGAQLLHFKSSLVEEAVNELINMLLDVDVPPEEAAENVCHENASPSGNTSGERWDIR
jgi:dynein heavy chain